MYKQLKIILSLALIMSVMLMAVCGLHYFNLRSRLKDTQQRLSESLDTWQSVDTEKRALQDDLKLVRNDLKEANQFLAEWEEKSVSMQSEIDELKAQIESLKAVSPQTSP